MTNLPALLDDALDAAAEAAFAALSRLGGDRGDCGNAYPIITARKGRKALVALIEGRTIRTSRHCHGGVAVHLCRNLQAQSRLPYEEAAHAFVDKMRAAGIEAHVYSYAD